MKPTSASRVTRNRDRAAEAMFELENGATMDQKTFHALYLQTPEGFKAELIGGVVYVASPTSSRHGFPHARLILWLGMYMNATEWTEVGDNTTNVLGVESEPQPDAFLIIDPRAGGQTTIDKKGYVQGAPELVAEVAHTTASIDLNSKKADYEAAGAKEYLVVLVRERAVRWFVRDAGRFRELVPDSEGLLRSVAFPGLWLDPKAFFMRPTRRLLAALQGGLDSPEHAAFVAELKARRTTTKKSKAKKPPKK